MLWQLKDSEQRLLALAKQVLWCEVVTDLSERFQDDLYDNQIQSTSPVFEDHESSKMRI